MRAYVYQAELLCEDCAVVVAEALHVSDDNGDSNNYPQGPHPDGGGEADSPCHCAQCGVFLENPLTDEGDTYVRGLAKAYDGHDKSWAEIAAAAREDGRDHLAQWFEFYFAPGM